MLAGQAAQGDPDAIQTLVMELGGGMLRTVRKVLGSQHADVEDVTQDAVLGMLAGLATFRGDSTVAHFANRVALRRALHARRHFAVRDRVGGLSEDIEEASSPTDQSPFELAVARQRRRVVRELLGQLSAPVSEALAMHFMFGYTVDEIATALESSPNTVWSRLKLGKRALRAALAKDEHMQDLLQGLLP